MNGNGGGYWLLWPTSKYEINDIQIYKTIWFYVILNYKWIIAYYIEFLYINVLLYFLF